MRLKPNAVFPLAPAPDRLIDETSEEPFDRIEFAHRALDLVRPLRTTVAVCEGAVRMRVECGPRWGHRPAARWALLAIPTGASRRAIALAVAELADVPRAYALDVLMIEAEGPAGAGSKSAAA